MRLVGDVIFGGATIQPAGEVPSRVAHPLTLRTILGGPSFAFFAMGGPSQIRAAQAFAVDFIPLNKASAFTVRNIPGWPSRPMFRQGCHKPDVPPMALSRLDCDAGWDQQILRFPKSGASHLIDLNGRTMPQNET
jgi:hypothetical protein